MERGRRLDSSFRRFDYLGSLSGSVSYVTYHGDDLRTKNEDREHMSVSLSYHFNRVSGAVARLKNKIVFDGDENENQNDNYGIDTEPRGGCCICRRTGSQAARLALI